MLTGLNSNWWLAAAYATAMILTLRAGLVERTRLQRGATDDLLPSFWLLASVMLAAMAFARAGDIGGLIADFGRRRARSSGWYESRQTLQTVAVGVVVATWITITSATLLRVPARRQRYLPMLLVLGGLICLLTIRLVSLHQIDTVLYRTTFAGARIGVLIELASLALASAMTFWQPTAPTRESTLRHRAVR